MLYSILPPILVVLSLVGIIVFLVKKSSKIKKAFQEDKALAMRSKITKVDISENANGESNGNKWKKAENWFLIFLEKMTKRLKTIFLRLEVWFNNLSTRIRNRRNKTELPVQKNDLKIEKEDEILEKVISYKTKSISENISEVKPREEREKKIEILAQEEEKVPQPMISKEATLPKSGIKSKLEELLIERVASNPKDIEAYERLGEYYMEIENYSDAKECFKQVLKLNPTNRNVKYKIKRLERLLGN